MDPIYAIKPQPYGFTVSKFDGHQRPTAIYHINSQHHCSCRAFSQSPCKHTLILSHWLSHPDKEQGLFFSPSGHIVGKIITWEAIPEEQPTRVTLADLGF